MTAEDPHVLGPGLAPTPFTADEIRQGCRPGRPVSNQKRRIAVPSVTV